MLFNIVYIWLIWLILKFPSFDIRDTTQCEIYENSFTQQRLRYNNSLVNQLIENVDQNEYCQFHLKLLNTYQFNNNHTFFTQENNKTIIYDQQCQKTTIIQQTIIPQCIPLNNDKILQCLYQYFVTKSNNKIIIIEQQTKLILYETKLTEREFQNLKIDVTFNNKTSFAVYLNNKIIHKINNQSNIYKVDPIDFIRLSQNGHHLYAQRGNRLFYVRFHHPKCQLSELEDTLISMQNIQFLTFETSTLFNRDCLLALTQHGELLHIYVEVDSQNWKNINAYEIIGIFLIIICVVSVKINYF